MCIDLSLNIGRNGDEEVFKWLRSKLKFICKYVCCDRELLRLWFKKIIKMFKKSKLSIKCIKCYIMYNILYLFGLKNFLFIDFWIYFVIRLCRSRFVGKNIFLVCCCMIYDIYIKIRINISKYKYIDVLFYVNDGCGLNNCYLIKCNK